MMLKAPLTWGSSPISNGWPTKPWAVRGVAWTVTWATPSGSMSWEMCIRDRNVTRLSPAFYNTFEEIDACVAALERVVPLLQGTARSGR